MTIYYEIPQNCSYENFAKTFIQLKLYTAKYVQQFTVSNKTILYIGNKKILALPANISALTFKSPQIKTERTPSSVCCSIRINDLNSNAKPYEYNYTEKGDMGIQISKEEYLALKCLGSHRKSPSDIEVAFKLMGINI